MKNIRLSKKNIENFVKYGIPAIVVLLIIYAFTFLSNAGSDSEFGGVGATDSFLLIIAVFLILYFVAGIIIWAITKKKYILISALISLIIAIITIFASL